MMAALSFDDCTVIEPVHASPRSAARPAGGLRTSPGRAAGGLRYGRGRNGQRYRSWPWPRRRPSSR